jgi:hypothetical protein
LRGVPATRRRISAFALSRNENRRKKTFAEEPFIGKLVMRYVW